MGFFKNLFCRKKETPNVAPLNQGNTAVSNEMHYFIYMDNEVYGPFTLQELKSDYPILEDTLITTDTLNGEWYEARCFECFDELFNRNQGFYINEFGEIVKTR
ncbi:MAG: hypothetical protein LBH19_02150 [Dysgonamonadaceae bacterium]|jgi:hypothetical protein|nr:hypothetical protein [Dysgonamonadaceae bacterium]